MKKYLSLIIIVIGTATVPSLMGAVLDSSPTNSNSSQTMISTNRPPDIWVEKVGEGFQSTVRTFDLEAGATAGIRVLGGSQYHDLALASLAYGHMWGGLVGKDHWYQGNWEIRGELFGGEQFSPHTDWVIGLTPHLRYNLATGTRLVPFGDLGAGVTATEIGAPDLSGTFEFNLQANVGLHWFVRDDLALTAEVGYLHMSCGGITTPNLGLNCVKGMVGVTWFF